MDLINRLQHELAHELRVINGSMGKIDMLKRILAEESETVLDSKSAVNVGNEGKAEGKEDVRMVVEGGEGETVDKEAGEGERGKEEAVEEKDDEDEDDEDFAALMDEDNEIATVCFGVNGEMAKASSAGKKRMRKQQAQERGGKMAKKGCGDEAKALVGMETEAETEAETGAETEAGTSVRNVAPAEGVVTGSKRAAGEVGCSEEDQIGWESEEEPAGAEEEEGVEAAGGESVEELELERLPVGITKIKFKEGHRTSENRFEPRLPNGTRLNRMKLGPQKSVYLAVYRQQMVICGLKKKGYLAADYPCMFAERQFRPETIEPMEYYIGQIEKAREKSELKKKEQEQREEELAREAAAAAAASGKESAEGSAEASEAQIAEGSAAQSTQASAVEREAQHGGGVVVSRFFLDDLRFVPRPASGVRDA